MSERKIEGPQERVFRLEAGEIDMERGTFPMVLATDAEASDGDILHIAGAIAPDRVPLQNSHWNDTRETLGSVTGFRKDLKDTPKKLRAVGQIELGGPLAEVRQDLAYMVSQGHIHAVSVRWNPLKYERRVNLSKSHYAFVDAETEKDPRKRYGYFHSEWEVMEGSLVAVPADRNAIIGRADATDGPVREFWRAVAERLEGEAVVRLEGVAYALDLLNIPTPVVEPEAPSEEALRAAWAAQVREWKARGLDPVELLEAARAELAPAPTTEQIVADQAVEIAALRERLAALEMGRATPGEPTPPLRSLDEIFTAFEARLRDAEARALPLIQRVIDSARGKVTPGMGLRETLHAEANALLARTEKADLQAMIERFEHEIATARERLLAN